MIKAPFILLILVCLATLPACNRMKFNKEKWSEASDIGSPSICRKQMLHDVVTNHKLKGLKYKDLVNYLGSADGVENSKVYYKIIIDYGSNIDPVYTKDLVFSLSHDSVVKSFQVVEWKH